MINIKRYVGETSISSKGEKMTLIEYNCNTNITVQFEDGTIVEHKRYSAFKKGKIENPNFDKRIGNTNTNTKGQKMTIIAYRNSHDIDVQFEDGTIVEHKTYGSFTKGKIKNPNYKGTNLTGQRFGKLLVLERAEDYVSPKGYHQIRWKCKCDCGNITDITIRNLIYGKAKSCGCVKKRNLNHQYIKKGINDLASQRPDLLEEWDYEKNTIKPNETTCHSSKKVWWKCSKCGNSWNAKVGSRTKINGTNCPNCNLKKTSFPEQALYYYVKQIFSDAINSDNHLGMEFDIYIPSLDVAIEYDGDAWHNFKKNIQTDIKKNQLCIDNNIELIRIREPRCVPIINCTVFYRKDSVSNLSLDIVISDVIRYLTSSITIDIDTVRDTPIILSQYATKQYENSLSYCYPDIAKEWHPTKNGSLTPEKVYKSTNKKIWWLCKNGHEWQSFIDCRTRHNQGCPYCKNKRLWIGFNDLKTKYPKIAEEWHPIKNGDLTPDKVLKSSKKKIWWKCNKCGYEWQSFISHRIYNKSNCRMCAYKKRSLSVVCIETNEKFEKGTLASKFANLKSTRYIYNCCRGKQETAGGYHWKFADDNKNKALIS